MREFASNRKWYEDGEKLITVCVTDRAPDAAGNKGLRIALNPRQ